MKRKMEKIIKLIIASFICLCTFEACQEENKAEMGDTAPRLISIIPSKGYPGTSAIISGVNFSDNQQDVKVYADEKEVKVTKCTRNRISVVMPDIDGNKKEVKIRVVVNGTESGSSLVFDYVERTEQELVITGINPSSAYEGEKVTIFGDNFSKEVSENEVTFGGVKAQVLTASYSALEVIAPEHEPGTVEVVVSNAGRVAKSMFKYQSLAIVSNSPSSGSAGIEVTLVGEGFSSTLSENEVTVGGVRAEVIKASEESLVVVMPDIPVKTYQFTVRVKGREATGGEYTYAGNWYVETVLGSFTGTTETIEGTGLAARLRNPQDLIPFGNSYYVTVRAGDHGIYKIADKTLSKVVTAKENPLLTNTFPWGGDVDADGTLYFTGKGVKKIFTLTSSGELAEYKITNESGEQADYPNPMKVLCGKDGEIYILSRGASEGKGAVLKVVSGKIVKTYPLAENLWEMAAFNHDKTKIFLIGSTSWKIWLLDIASGEILHIAGNGNKPTAETYSDGEKGNPLTATIGASEGMVCTEDGTLYFGDFTSSTVRMLRPGAGGDYTKGTVATIAGKKFDKAAKDGISTNAVFNYPNGMALAPDGETIMMVDGTSNGTIRKIYYK